MMVVVLLMMTMILMILTAIFWVSPDAADDGGGSADDDDHNDTDDYDSYFYELVLWPWPLVTMPIYDKLPYTFYVTTNNQILFKTTKWSLDWVI